MLTRGAASAASGKFRFLAFVMALALLGAACGGGDDDGGGDDASDRESGAQSDVEEEEEDAGEPQPGGSLTYGLEADTSTPWTPSKSVCAISCHMVMRTVFDPLTLPNADGDYVGNLLETIEPNAEFTEWTLTPRAGITFHDGTPMDAEAIRYNLEAQRASFLTGKALTDVTGVALDGETVKVTMSRPWTSFPVYLAGQIGYIGSPTWLEAAKADPSLEAKPVGTGPFTFVSYEVGNNFVAEKNADYWRADEGLPYLDGIEWRFLPDVNSRMAAIDSGDLDIMHTSRGTAIDKYRGSDSLEMQETDTFGETNYILLNVDDPESPLSDVRVRRALAMAIPLDELTEARSAGVNPVANGPFSPEQVGYLEDSGYPAYDVEAAKALIAEAEADIGPISFNFNTTTDQENLLDNQLIQQYWQAIDVDVTLNQVEQGAYIVEALLGNFQGFAWRNHGGSDPDGQRIWWHSETAEPPGSFALNFGRIKDEVIDENLDIIRESDDDATRQEAAETINRRFGEQAYNIWTTWTVWGIVHRPEIHGIGGFELPGGGGATITGAGIAGTHQVAAMWVEQ